MIKYNLEDFFTAVNYDWKKDSDVIEEICRLTKTRIKNPVPDKILSGGMEQVFFLKACTDYFKPKNILEIGTGRGTGSFAMALTDSVENIHTVDIIPHTEKQYTAIGYEAANASVSDLNRLIKGEEKEKITFYERHPYEVINKNTPPEIDFAFIDGEHTNKDVIKSDFELCKRVLDKNGVIVWDDYDENKDEYQVKNVIADIREEYDVEVFLVQFRNHLFGDNPEKDSGEIVMFKKGLYENLAK